MLSWFERHFECNIPTDESLETTLPLDRQRALAEAVRERQRQARLQGMENDGFELEGLLENDVMGVAELPVTTTEPTREAPTLVLAE